MISIIIPSRSAVALAAISENIAKTIGVPFEIIDYDNTEDGFGICKIYNLCAQKAQFDTLVFCHDDLLFESENWGVHLCKILGDKNVGLVGVAGATFKSKYPAPWVAVPQEFYRCQLTNKFPLNAKDYEEVAVLDGCFIAMRAEVWREFLWNENQLKGFHLYDIDMSTRVFANYKLVVARTFKLKHLSAGKFDTNWYQESKAYFDKNSKLFPTQVDKIDRKYINYLDAYALKSLIFRRDTIKLSNFEVLNYISKIFSKYPKILNKGFLRYIIRIS
mgnify:CR=1 FL=1